MRNLESITSYWTHVTVTCNLTVVSMFFNGTLILVTPVGWSDTLRWADTSALFLGGYVRQQVSDTTLVTADQTQHFYGWMDDLAFYNRVLSVDEIAKNWQQAVDVTDPSLFLYYNFDEGPGSTVIKNHGTIGSQGDMYNGQILGSTTYLEFNSQATLSVKQAVFSPGVPVIGASSSLPVVFAVDAGATARLRIACQLTTTTTTAASLIPSRAQFLGPGSVAVASHKVKYSIKATDGSSGNGGSASSSTVRGSNDSNILSSAKTFVDANAVIPSQQGGHSPTLEQDGTLPTAAVIVSAKSETKIKEISNKTITGHAHPRMVVLMM